MAAHQITCPHCNKASDSERDILDNACHFCRQFHTHKDAGMFFLSQGYQLPLKLPIGWCGIQEMVCGEHDVLVNMTHDCISARICFKTRYEAYDFLTSWDGIEMPDPGTCNITKIKEFT